MVPIDGYRKRGLADEQWVETGKFADDGLSRRFRDYHAPAPAAQRKRLAKVDFAMNH